MPPPFSVSASPGAQSEAPLLKALDIVRRDPARKVLLLNSITLQLNAGDRVALSGLSGAGKSLFLRALALLDPLDGGRVLWHGKDVADIEIPTYRRQVAYVGQRPAMFDGTVEDNLRYPFSLKVYRDTRFDRDKVARLLRQGGREEDFLQKRASELSGGEAQIAALIRVLQLDPQVLLLDEPTASLDPLSTSAIETLVSTWFRHIEMTMPNASGGAIPARASIWISHDPQQIQRVGWRHLTMTAGTLAEGAMQ